MDYRQRFDDFYRAGPPWEIGRPQKEYLQLFDSTELRGKVLDAGCGTGEHALELARRGLPVIGVDISPIAIDLARAKAQERGLAAEFVVGDAFDLQSLGQRFNTVIDSGLYHVLVDPEPYIKSLASVLEPGGRVHLLCYSDQEPPGPGPRRVTQNELRGSFARGFRIDSIREARCENHIRAEGAHGWLVSITRLEDGAAP
jgi:SAM-dependent methyltransferase